MKRNNLLKNFIARFFLTGTLACLLSSPPAMVFAAEPEEVVLADGVEEIEMTEEDGEASFEEPQTPQKTSWGDNTQATLAEIVVEGSASPGGDVSEVTVESDLVDAPPIAPEGSAADNNIFGVEGMYYVTVPKRMAFYQTSGGNYETVEASRYTVNSGLDESYRLSVRVSGVNVDDTVQLSNAATSVNRKAVVSTMAYDVWNYRPDGTRLTVNGADAYGYGKELVLEGPGKLFGKCRLSQYGDDDIYPGTWSGTILFTVTCTPDPEQADLLGDKDGEANGASEEDVDAAEGDFGDEEEESPVIPATQAATPVERASDDAMGVQDILEPGVPEGGMEEELSAGEPVDDAEAGAPKDNMLVESTDNEDGNFGDGELVDLTDNEPSADAGEGTGSPEEPEDLGSAMAAQESSDGE